MLGAKTALEILGTMVIPPFSAGLKAIGIKARDFVDSHGGEDSGLDLQHVDRGLKDFDDVKDVKKLEQVVWGCYIACSSYLEHMKWVKPYPLTPTR